MLNATATPRNGRRTHGRGPSLPNDVADLDAQALLSILMHELRSPLATLTTSADLLAGSIDDIDPQDARSLVLRIQRSASWIQCLLDNLSVVARLDSRRLRFFPTTVDLTACVDTALTIVQPALERRGQTVTGVAQPWNTIWGDERSITQVLVNLLTNASKYGDPDSEIRITCESDGRLVKVAVHNDGPLIPPGEQERIFGRYERGKAAILSGASGLGLGLYIVKTLIELQDGEVGVSSAPGEGVTFQFSLRTYSA